MDLFKILCKTGAMLMVLVMIIGCLAIVPNDASAASEDWVLEGEDTIERIAYASCELPDGRIFVVGGNNLTASLITNETWLFDPQTSEWDQVADCPLIIESSAAVAMPDGKVYLFGGMVSMTLITDLLIYDVATDTWSNGTALPQNTIMWEAAAIDDEVIMLVGGLDGDLLSDTTAKCFLYNTANSTFYPAPDLPDDRFWGAMTVFGSYVYYFGGSETGGAGTSTIYAYSINGGYWTSAGTLPEVLTGMTATAGSDGLIYLIGGTSSFGWFNLGSDSAYVYSTFYQTVTALPALHGPIVSATSFETDDGRILYMLGNNGSDDNSDLYSLQIWEMEAWLTSSTVDHGDSALLYVSIHTNFMKAGGLYGNVYLVKGNVTVGPYVFDSVTKIGAMIEIPISESMAAGDYEILINDFNVSDGLDQKFSFEPLTLTVTSDPSVQDQLDDLVEQNDDLQDQLNETNAELSDLKDSTDAKLDAMIGYVILIIALASLAVSMIMMVRKR